MQFVGLSILIEETNYYDEKELWSEQYQRPYQYLVELSNHPTTLDKFSYSSPIKVDYQHFFKTVLKYG